jgi:hypothetical protein
MKTTLLNLVKRIVRRSTRCTATAASSSFRPTVEGLEDRLVLMNNIAPTTASALLYQFLQGQVRTMQQLGPRATANDFGNAGMQTVGNAINRGGLGAIGGMNSLQANNYVFSSGLADRGSTRTPDGFNPLTMYTGTTYQVSNDIAQRYSPTGTLNMNYLGILSDPHYGLTTLPQTAHMSGTAATVLNLGVVQNGASYLARRPDGSQALPSDYRNLPYGNNQIFTPSKIDYSNPNNNPWNH